MKPERWNEVDKVLQSVLERPPEEREAFVDEVCSGDEELRREVLTLMAAHDEAGNFMGTPALEGSGDVFEGGPKLKPGDEVGSYKIIRPIGRGGMGEVYLAVHRAQKREVALKILPQHFLDDAERVQRFRQEAEAVLSLNHPNIVTVYDIGEEAGVQYISTEFIEGQTLRERMGDARLTVEEAVEIALQVASALAYAHERGVVHRDVKPENIMLRPDGYVKVLDFGIAKLTERRGAMESAPDSKEARTRMMSGTTPGMVIGTAHYMSPEQARGLPVDERTDTWSLGVVLYEMLAGRQPFEGETPSDVISVILQRDPLPLSALLTGAPAELESLISKALNRSKNERYQTAKDFHADLRRFKRQYERESDFERSTPGGTRSISPKVSTGDGAPAINAGVAKEGRATSSAEYLVGKLKRRRKGLLISLAALALIALAGFAGYRLWNRGRAGQIVDAGATATRAPRLTPVPVNGNVLEGAISPDGKYVVYRLLHRGPVVEVSLWVRHLPTSSAVQILPPTKDFPFQPSFSGDSNYIYYGQFAYDTKVTSVSKISVLGGAPKNLIADVGISDFKPSPDGRQMAFIRAEQSGEIRLLVANEDGTGERLLAARDNVTEILRGIPAWSPDGKTIACFIGTTAGGLKYSPLAVNVADGTQKQVGTKAWVRATTLAWLGDGSGLIASVGDATFMPRQIWHVSYPDGVARKLTNDLSDYFVNSATSDSQTLLAVQKQTLMDIWVGPLGGDASQLKQITFTKGDEVRRGAWTPDGKIVVSSVVGEGNHNLWIMNADGSDRRQLTSGSEDDYNPSPSPDGRFVTFTSTRGDGPSHVWRVDVDGSNLRQLTFGDIEDTNRFITPDGKWVLFNSFRGGKYNVWKLSLDGGEPIQLSKDLGITALSPDGNLMACFDLFQQSGKVKISILRVENGETTKVIELPADIAYDNFGWTADGRALTMIKSTNGVDNIWTLPLDGSPPKQLTRFTDTSMNDFSSHAPSQDGRQVAVTRVTENTQLVLITDFR